MTFEEVAALLHSMQPDGLTDEQWINKQEHIAKGAQMGHLSDGPDQADIDDEINELFKEETLAEAETTWETRDGRRIHISAMEETHLLNALRQTSAVERYKASGLAPFKQEVLAAKKKGLEDDVKRRGLQPLADFSSWEEACATAAVSRLYMHWRRVPADRRAVAVNVIKGYLEDDAKLTLLGKQIADDPTANRDERCVYLAMRDFVALGQRCSDPAREELSRVFARWTVVAEIDKLV